MQLMGDREKWHELSDNKIYAGDVSRPFFCATPTFSSLECGI